ncbi:hypothetical protein FNW52_14565 [Flavobacterium sp. ZT3R18]|uniref:hypothetical protein n=1 Tax=Flavobacterium sp. ZT3R18 TaxID=2594429 RepID=UPI00117A7DD1|nr:hypothetical protein [Flavobacterium sp. ZT3R18]TRX34031.1 hypothetical protein FNW52_14565 [Flavobacterium sp. ZT3R18]
MENEQLSNNLINKSFKTVIVILILVLLSGLFYVYKRADRSKSVIVTLQNQKAYTLKELRLSESKLNKVMVNNNNLSKQLATERAKLKKLIAEYQKADVTESLNLKFQKKSQDLQNNVFFLMKELDRYKKKADSTSVALVTTKKTNDNLLSKNSDLKTQNKSLNTKIEGAAVLSYLDFKITPYKLRNSGKQIETDKASRADLLKLSFTIAENRLSKAKEKKYYIQVIDNTNNVLGDNKTILFGKKSLSYSIESNVNYKNKSVTIDTEIPVSDLTKGMYYANVFDDSNMVLSTSFDLK